MKKMFWLLAALCLAALAAGQAWAQGKTLHADRYDVYITVLPNGDMRVIEKQTISFTSGTFSQGFAAIPTGRTENIADIQVIGDDQAFKSGDGEKAGTFDTEIEAGQIAIYWGFQPTSNSTHVYEVRYTVQGGLRYYPEYGEVWWKAIPPEHAYEIRQSIISVELPPGAAILANPDTGLDYAGTEPQITDVELSADRLKATFVSTRAIAPDEEVEVRVRFAPGVVAGQAPRWQAGFDEKQAEIYKRDEWAQRYGNTIHLALGLLGAVVWLSGPLAVLGLWYVRGRDPNVGLVADQISSPPSDLPPGMVGALIDEQVNLQDIMSTLIDLARRSYLTIAESSIAWDAADFNFARADKPLEDLRPYERALLDQFFTSFSPVMLSTLRAKFADALPRLRDDLNEALVREGYFAENPHQTRQRYRRLSGWILGLSAASALIVNCALLMGTYVNVLCSCFPFIGALLTGGLLWLAAPVLPRKTRKGAEEAARWRAFGAYLRQMEKYNTTEMRARFDEFLPYAVAFGLEKAFVQKFSAEPVAAPVWYTPLVKHPVRLDRGSEIRPGMGQPSAGWGQSAASASGGWGQPDAAPSAQRASDSAARSAQSLSDGLISLFTSAAGGSSSRSASRGWGGSSRRSSSFRSSSSRSSSGFRRGGGGGGGRRGFR